jgi:hypothetical protein
MADENAGSELDLDAILAARWADPAVFPAGELVRADQRREALTAALAAHSSFKGEWVTRFPTAERADGGSGTTTRLVFAFTVDGVEVDLSALTEEDFVVACRMLDDIEANMTEQERIAHTWVKHLLRSAGRLTEYAEWKLVTYARFCPEFTWVPISEPA